MGRTETHYYWVMLVHSRSLHQTRPTLIHTIQLVGNQVHQPKTSLKLDYRLHCCDKRAQRVAPVLSMPHKYGVTLLSALLTACNCYQYDQKHADNDNIISICIPFHAGADISPRLWPYYAHPYAGYIFPGGCNSKRKGGQVRFTPQQTQSLERRFAGHKYLSPEDRRHLALQLKLSDRQVRLAILIEITCGHCD